MFLLPQTVEEVVIMWRREEKVTESQKARQSEGSNISLNSPPIVSKSWKSGNVMSRLHILSIHGYKRCKS